MHGSNTVRYQLPQIASKQSIASTYMNKNPKTVLRINSPSKPVSILKSFEILFWILRFKCLICIQYIFGNLVLIIIDVLLLYSILLIFLQQLVSVLWSLETTTSIEFCLLCRLTLVSSNPFMQRHKSLSPPLIQSPSKFVSLNV